MIFGNFKENYEKMILARVPSEKNEKNNKNHFHLKSSIEENDKTIVKSFSSATKLIGQSEMPIDWSDS